MELKGAGTQRRSTVGRWVWVGVPQAWHAAAKRPPLALHPLGLPTSLPPRGLQGA